MTCGWGRTVLPQRARYATTLPTRLAVSRARNSKHRNIVSFSFSVDRCLSDWNEVVALESNRCFRLSYPEQKAKPIWVAEAVAEREHSGGLRARCSPITHEVDPNAGWLSPDHAAGGTGVVGADHECEIIRYADWRNYVERCRSRKCFGPCNRSRRRQKKFPDFNSRRRDAALCSSTA